MWRVFALHVEDGFAELLFFGLDDAGEVLRMLGGERLGDAGDTAVGSGGGGEIARAFVALSFELVIAFGRIPVFRGGLGGGRAG